jgi:O-antigen ligase
MTVPADADTLLSARSGSAKQDLNTENPYPEGQYWDPAGTTRARLITWQMVWSEAVSSPARIAFGVGFGPNIVADAGATAIIGDSPENPVRSPHNFLLTVFARTGVVGVAALAFFFFMVAWSSLRVFRNNDQLSLIGLLLIVALLIGSLVGVIMESPFGAVPVYWAAGIVMASAVPPLRTIRLGHVRN